MKITEMQDVFSKCSNDVSCQQQYYFTDAEA